MTAEAALRTGRIGSDADVVPEVLKEAAVAGAELGKGYTLAAWEGFFRAVDRRRTVAEKRVWAEVVDDFEYRVRVKCFDCFFVF